jgi:hypothetical protein
MQIKRMLALSAALLLVAALFSGCGGKGADNGKTVESGGSGASAETGSDAAASPAEKAAEETSSPYKIAAGKFKADGKRPGPGKNMIMNCRSAPRTRFLPIGLPALRPNICPRAA